MQPAQWQQIKEIVASTLELPPEARGAYIEGACRDSAERTEVRALIRACDGYSEFLESPAPAMLEGSPSERPAAALARGDRVGSFRILRLLGEGGMGEVFLAEQTEPIHRTVALKILRADLRHHGIGARFEAERQVLALMKHPNIAQVFEAGSYGNRPYFAMEYVKGSPLTTHCDVERFSIEQRLALFIEVCRGVEHAHRKGIIHRDLKPSNVLVTQVSGRAMPKIIDFGIAKAMAAPNSELEPTTQHGQWLGTPDYMSPEQAGGAEQAIDTRTDVYSLGVMLYQLLVGLLPFETAALRHRGLAELLRVLRHEAPVRPSDRLLEGGGLTSATAETRRLTVRDLRGRLQGDLDLAVIRALEKDPEQRYPSAASLAEDLERHLNHLPLLAGPPGKTYRLRKFVRRHRFGVLSAAALLVSLSAGVVGTTFGLLRARQAEEIAREQARGALQEAERTRLEAKTATRVTNFMIDLFNAADLDLASSRQGMTLREVLDQGAARVRSDLKDEPEIQARLMNTIGACYLSLGLLRESRDLQEEAVRLRSRHFGDDDLQLADYRHQLSAVQRELGEFEASRKNLDLVVEVRRRQLGSDHYLVSWTLNDLGIIMGRLGDHASARKYLEQALALKEQIYGPDHEEVAVTLSNLGMLLINVGDSRQSLPVLERSLRISERSLPPDHPRQSYALTNLGLAKVELGDYAEARDLFTRALVIDEAAYGPDHHYVGVGWAHLAKVASEQGECAKARRQIDRGLLILESAFPSSHPQRVEAIELRDQIAATCLTFDPSLMRSNVSTLVE